jgi:signal transduction histidine kinase
MRARDTGTGIASDIIDRVFDPFFTGHAGGQHAGLGLAVVHAIMEHCQGTPRRRSCRRHLTGGSC